MNTRKQKVKVEKPSHEEIQFVVSLFEKYNFDGSKVRSREARHMKVVDKVMRYLYVTGQVEFVWNWFWRERATMYREDFEWLLNLWLEKGWGAEIPKSQVRFWVQKAFDFGRWGPNSPAIMDWVPWGAASERVVFKLKNRK